MIDIETAYAELREANLLIERVHTYRPVEGEKLQACQDIMCAMACINRAHYASRYIKDKALDLIVAYMNTWAIQTIQETSSNRMGMTSEEVDKFLHMRKEMGAY